MMRSIPVSPVFTIGVIARRSFTTSLTLKASSHSHSHSDFNSDNHINCGGHTHSTEIPKPNPLSDPKARFDVDEQGRKKLKAHPFQSVHGHDDPDFPELKELDLEGDAFEIQLNQEKKTVWTRIKKFFDPHSPLINITPTITRSANSTGDDHSHSHESGSGVLGHSHSHAGGHTAEELEFYKTGSFRKNPGVKITVIGLGVNVGMAITKGVTGAYFHSQALVADAVHSVGDTISDVLTLLTVNSAVKIPSENYPLGFGKIETIGSLFVSAILLYAGIQIGWSSLVDILTPVLPHSIIDFMASVPGIHSHSHSHIMTTTSDVVTTATDHAHGHEHAHGTVTAEPVVREVANINAAWVAAGSILVKEWLFKATKNIGEKMGSKVLIANAWHHRVDSLTSFVALATISGGYLFNIYWLDSFGGLIVSIMVIKVGLSGVVQAFKELTDKALLKTDARYEDLETKINVLLMQNDSKFIIKDLVILPSGANLNCNVTIGLSSLNKTYENQLTMDKIAQIAKNVKGGLHQDFPNLKRITVELDSK